MLGPFDVLARRATVMVFLATGLVSAWFGYGTLIPIDDTLVNAHGELVGADFPVFYAAGAAAAARDTTSLYDPVAFAKLQESLLGTPISGLPFLYPPTALFLWAPFGKLPYLHALWLWSAIMVLAMAWCAWRLAGHWIAAVFAVVSPLTVNAVAMGQNGVLLAIFMSLGLISLQSRPYRAGGILGLLAIKPHLAIALPVCLAAGRHWRAILGAFFTVFVMSVAAAIIFGIDNWIDFLNGLSPHSGKFFAEDNRYWARIPSVTVSISRLAGSAEIGWIAQIAASVSALGAGIYVWRTTDDRLLRVTALVMATLLVTPHVMDYDVTILMLPISIGIGEVIKGRKLPGLFGIGFIFWCFYYLSTASKALGWHPGPFIFAAVLVYVIVLSRRTRMAHTAESAVS